MAAAPPGTPAPKALSRSAIIEKLNAVPTFALLDPSKSVVSIQDGKGGESCSWYTDAEEARRMLGVAREANPEVALHLGVTPLGLAFSLVAGWSLTQSVAEQGVNLTLQGSSSIVASMASMLQQQLAAQGLDPGRWQLPVFCCDELQSASLLPMFLSRHDLVRAWIAAGHSREDVPENLTVMDLRVLVAQMQTDAFAWEIVEFVGSEDAAALVQEAKQMAEEEPPPLE